MIAEGKPGNLEYPSLRVHAADYAAWYKHASGEWLYNVAKGEILSRKTGKPVPFRPTKTGYLRVSAKVKGVSIGILKHRAIWVVAHGILCLPLDYELEVDHINHDKFDCRLENLRFVTHAENMRYQRKPFARETILAIRRRCAEGVTSKSLIAAEYGVSPSTIQRIAARKSYQEVFDE